MPQHVVIDLARPEHLQKVLLRGGTLALSACIESEIRGDSEVILMIPPTVGEPRRTAEFLNKEIFVGVHRHFDGFRDDYLKSRIDQLAREIGATDDALNVWLSNRLTVVLLGDARAASYWGLRDGYRTRNFHLKVKTMHPVLL